ncbi:chemotaxis response regulator CheY [Virgisporangium ochraceum]|jgi:two-component system chemotaxis response regulator CheY|uniref:Chemotaxis protein CheY n=1 Tax=Virgisporangium ochraceum TaxID=65505 RepID=A0A8J3ZUF1_9ACTN|nr:response regulator [Virgisporangium ochraceum]GIJ69841.1 chemotaxis protein CheY [Virgisporangium ochraceum]
MQAMVIDDSRAMRLILARIAGQLGFDVIQAGNGREALDRLEELDETPELALVDWNMPEMNGLEFILAVRKEPKYKSMTLMMVTTESEQGQIVRALAAGAHEYVIKPFTPDAIVEKLALLGLVRNGVSA